MSHEDRARRKAQLLAAYEQGILDEDTYQAARGGHDVPQMPAIRAAAKGFHPLPLAVQPNPGPQRRFPSGEGPKEAARGEKADDGRLAQLIEGLVDLAPGAVSAVVSAFASPILAGIAGPVTKYVLDKLKRP